MTGVAPICLEYRRLMPEVVGEPIRCEAFPDGIPGPILDSEANHVFAFRGDHGPRFEPCGSGRYQPTLGTLTRLAKALGVPATDLLR